MSTRTISYISCDGCGKNDLADDEIWFTDSHVKNEWMQLDICNECDEAARYICRLCWSVHDDDHPCERMKREFAEQEEWERANAETLAAVTVIEADIPF